MVINNNIKNGIYDGDCRDKGDLPSGQRLPKKTTERSTIFQWENTRNVDWAMFNSYVANHQRFDGAIAGWCLGYLYVMEHWNHMDNPYMGSHILGKLQIPWYILVNGWRVALHELSTKNWSLFELSNGPSVFMFFCL